jgi:hypothetical protein
MINIDLISEADIYWWNGLKLPSSHREEIYFGGQGSAYEGNGGGQLRGEELPHLLY